jgi:two-component system, sensor histidine kinase ChiS
MEKFISITKKIAFLTILLIIGFTLFFMVSYKNSTFNKKPRAQNGVLDLRNWDFKKQGPISLDGEWEFYYGKLLTPEDFKFKDKLSSPNLINIPGNFTGYVYNGQALQGQGYATYRLKVLTDKAQDLYGVKTEFILTSHKLWVGNKLALESGQVGKSKREASPKVVPRTGSFFNDTGEFDIVLQVSNFTTGVTQIDIITLGTSEQIINDKISKAGFDLFLFGSTMVAGIYHFALYIKRRKDRSPLYFAVVCCLVALRTMLVGERFIQSIIPNINFIVNGKLLYWTFLLYIPVLIAFIQSSYPGIVTKALVKASSIAGIAYFALILVSSPSVYRNKMLPFEIAAHITLIYIIAKMIQKYVSGQENYEMGIVGMFAIFITRLNDILYEYSIIQTGSYAPVGLLIFIFAQSYVLANRFSAAFSKVEEMTEKLKSVDRLKDEFLANTSHELRTPLNGIIGLSGTLISGASGELSSDQRETLNLIQASAKRLSNLVNDLLDFSKLKNNEINLIKKPVNLRQLTNIVVKFCEPFTHGKDIKIENKISSDLAPVCGDEGRIEQIMYNLLGNAVKFTLSGTVTISALEKENSLEVTVSDTGIGISKEQLDTIFDPYYQGEGTRATYGGTGLGLHLTRRLVHLHGGQIQVQSEQNRGSSFTFTLPKCTDGGRCVEKLGIEMSKKNAGSSQLEEADSNDITLKGNGKILIVDDEAINIRVLNGLLKYENYNIITAACGEEAVRIIDSSRDLDLVILDMMLPDLLGYEVCTLIRERYSIFDLPILIMTADSRAESMVISFECGANDYVRKPFDRIELLARVKTLIELKHLVRQALELEKKVVSTSEQVERISENFEENKKALSELMEYDRLKTEFLANISHELRTPLNVIWSTIQLLQAKASGTSLDEASLGKYLKMMNQNSLRLLRLINNLIDTTRIDGGYLSINLSNNDIVYVVEEVTLSAADYMKAHHITLVFDTEVEEKYMAFDEDMVERIILNLLSNSVKFTRKSGQISVNIYDLGDKVQISVKDTGIGIPEDKLQIIFDRFAQVDSSMSRRSEGSGIGLSLVKSLVEMHGGTINVKSKLGEGSEFIIELPAQIVEDNDSANSSQYISSESKYIERAQIEFSDIYD